MPNSGVHRYAAALQSLVSAGARDRLARAEEPVVRRLCAGGKRIRTLGPAPWTTRASPPLSPGRIRIPAGEANSSIGRDRRFQRRVRCELERFEAEVDYGGAPVPWDPAVEEALCDSLAMRRSVGIDFGRDRRAAIAPDRRLLPPRSNVMCFLRRQQAS